MRFFPWRNRKREVTVQPVEETGKTDKVTLTIRASLNSATTQVSVLGDNALQVTAYKRALDVLSGSIARLPFQFMKRKGDTYVPFDASPYTYLLTTEPQRGVTAYRWKFDMVWRALHDGDAYVWPRVIDGEVVELVLIGRNCCSYDSTNGTYFISDIENGVYGTFREGEVVHVMFNSLDGRHGVPLWKLGARVLALAGTGDAETLERFAKGGNVRGIVSNNLSQGVGMGQYGTDQLESLADDIETQFKVMGRNIVGVPGDAKLTQFSMSSTDMQFLDSRKYAALQLSQLTGVPPVYLYDGGSSNYKEPQQTDTAFLTQTLDGYLQTIEGAFQVTLVGRIPGRLFLFDRRRINSMDANSLAIYYGKMIGNGIFTLNECRHFENLPPVEGGDEIYISTNLARLGSEKLGKAGDNEQNPDNNGNE